MKKAFITGTNGLLGNNLIIELIEAGYSVKGLVRNKSKYKGLPSGNLSLVEGNLFDNLREEMSGCDAVIHAAAETSQNLSKYDPYRQINVEATLSLLNCAIGAGVRRFIFVSSANSIGCRGNIQEPGREANPICPPFNKSLYAISKEEAEKAILRFKDRIDIIIVNPTFMLGAYDTKPSSGRIISMGSGKPVVFYTPGGKNFVYVRDVAKGIVNAISLGKNGERYLLCNENLTLKQFFQKLNMQLDKNPLMIGVPRWNCYSREK